MKRVSRIVAVIATLLLGTGAAGAIPPLTGTFLFDYDGCDPGVFPPDFSPVYDCGDFLLCEVATIGGFWKLFFDAEGIPVRYWEKQQVVGGVYEDGNPENFVPYDNLSLTYKFDPLTGDTTITGVWAMINVPGHGAILRDVGRIRSDLDGNITFEAGEHEYFNGEWDAVCAYLAGD